MLDVQATAAAVPQIVRGEEYRPPAWLVNEIELDTRLDPARTVIRSILHVERAESTPRGEPLRLDGGGGLRPRFVRAIPCTAEETSWCMEGDTLVIDLDLDAHSIEIEVEISPETNTQLMGLYESGGLLCTQCEAEGFRRITFFPDRPDVLARYSVRMEADKARFPILLSNGNRAGAGDLPDGRHWAEWRDPFPKPCYLFALVAGDLQVNRDTFVTMSGRTVDLGVWVRGADLPRTHHAMAALKASMAWDERVYGREYDLSEFNIVAVSDFNFGAMENKGLNIFNSRYVLADPDTATDADFDAVAAVVAHEYFHNWSGDRVTCRDWFQLSLKEGFTVFRDQGFSADQGSPAVKRIDDVRTLRLAQFPEDAGPLAHPIRPDSYLEISNFYTATVYNKGAEVIRMMATLLGPERFRAGCDRYFADFDGTAATCEDFVASLERASGIDLSQFRIWYRQAGTPRVTARLEHEPGTARARLVLEQVVPPTPGQPEKAPMPIPLRTALFARETGQPIAPEQLIVLDDAETEILFEGVVGTPVLSINRGFSAPVIIDAQRSGDDLAFLSAHDDDPFARYEATQQLMIDTLVRAIRGETADHAPVIEAIRRTLADGTLDRAFVAEAVILPTEAFLGDQLPIVDPVAIRRAREALRGEIGRTLEADWRAIYAATAANRFELSPAAKGSRRLRTVALNYLAVAPAADAQKLAYRQFTDADNMTDRQGALAVLANGTAPEREQALAAFFERYKDDALVLDKWFSTQALSMREDAGELVERLAEHPSFTLANPNRARALVGAFAGNQYAFHDASGRGYRLIGRMIEALDKINPQTAARLVPPLGRWRRLESGRAALMRAELERLVAIPGLSKDVFEQVSKSLG